MISHTGTASHFDASYFHNLFFSEIGNYMSTTTRAARLIDIPNHGQLAVFVVDTPILLFRHDNEVFALDDICTHTGDPLAGGEVDGYTVKCPWHGAQFDIRTGKNLCLPAVCPTGSHNAWVENGDVFVTLNE